MNSQNHLTYSFQRYRLFLMITTIFTEDEIRKPVCSALMIRNTGFRDKYSGH